MKVQQVIDLKNASEQDLALIERTEAQGDGRFVYLVFEPAINAQWQTVEVNN